MTRTLVIAGLLVACTSLGVVLSPTVFGGVISLIHEMQAPAVSGKHSRVGAPDTAAVVVPTFSEQKTAGPVILTSVKEAPSASGSSPTRSAGTNIASCG
jgi:hypothetical protein